MTPPKMPQCPVKAVRWVRSTAIVEVRGDIDLGTSSAFGQAMVGVLDENPKRIILNLKDVPYMDSSGVATLVKLLSRIRKNDCTLALACMTERMRSVFEITRLDGIFKVFATEREAMA